MPKKKLGKEIEKPVVKRSALRKASPQSTATRKRSSAKVVTAKSIKIAKKKTTTTGTVAKSDPTKQADSKPAPTKPSPESNASTAPIPELSLGRPLVTQNEKLYMLFHDDYQARQVFEFLRVENVKELEQYSQQQIIHLMSKPLRMTLDRIRQRLAQFKRSLKDDEKFAADYLKHSE